jgi:hypothetical protein
MYVPNNQKAPQTRGSAPSNTALKRALYTAQEAPGEPGIGRAGIKGSGLVNEWCLYSHCGSRGSSVSKVAHETEDGWRLTTCG